MRQPNEIILGMDAARLSQAEEPVELLSRGPQNAFRLFADCDIEQSIVERFEQQAVLNPTRVAVAGSRYSYTYDELNQRANRLARAILEVHGEGAEAIGLFLDKDAPMVAALMAVLKAGKLYVPLDPSQPVQRSSKILDDAEAMPVITDSEHLAAALVLAQGVRDVLNIEDADRGYAADNLGLQLSPDTLAFITYTSGSTGEPKGILQTHRNVLHDVANLTNGLHISSADRLSFLASFGTAQARIDIYSALLNGATLCPFNVKAEGLARLRDWLEEKSISIYHSTASVFRGLLGALKGDERFSKLRLVKVGGEPVLKKDAELFQRYFPDNCVLVSQFGCTEATTLCQMFLDKRTIVHRDVVPTGFALPGVELLLVDDSGQPVGPNAIGEIVVRGRYLAPGYWRKPELTRAKFEAIPGEPDVRLYRTGDLGSLSPAGCLEHHGRKDLQLKIRGFRVETAEVEAALHSLSDVKQAVVLARPRREGEKLLEAYVVAADRTAPTPGSLRALLAQRLPEHMVPSHFYLLDSLPLTPSGKIDLQSLQPIELNREALADSYVPPQSELELQIVKIWEELLGDGPIGIRHDFFEMGGDSLLAVCMMAEIEEASGIRIPVSTLLSAATVENLASCLMRALQEGGQPRIVQIQPQGSQPPLFFVHGQFRGGGLYCRDLARLLGSDQPFFAVMPHGLDGKPAPHTIQEMASDRVRDLIEIYPEGPIRLGGYCNGALVAFEMAQQLRKLGRQIDALALVEIHSPNVPYRKIGSLVRLASGVLRMDYNAQAKWFIRLRTIENRWRQASQRGISAQGAFLWQKLGSVSSRFAKLAKPIPKASEAARQNIRAVAPEGFGNVIDCYVPDSYRGRIVLLRTPDIGTQTANFSAADDPAAGWSEVAPQVQVYWLPGNHDSITREELDAIARNLSISFGNPAPFVAEPADSGIGSARGECAD